MSGRRYRLVFASGMAAALVLSCQDSNDRLNSPGQVSDRDDSDAVTSEGDAGVGEPTENARYSVPVPEELAPWADYAIPRVRLAREVDRVTIRYGFPRWLAGIRQPIELEGAPAGAGTPFDVSAGELGTGRCTQTEERFECHELLPGISVDRTQAEAFMLEAGLPHEEIERRLQVTEIFATDPIGILVFDLVEAPR